MRNNQLLSIDMSYTTKCVPTAKFRDDKVTLTVFQCFSAIWILKAEKVEIDGAWYININIEVNEDYTFTRQATGILSINYGRLSAYHSLDIPKKTKLVYKKMCTFDRYMREVEEKTDMVISVHIDKYTRLEMRRFGKFDEQSCLTDGRIVTGNRVFYVSKTLLSLYSPFFLDRFKHSDIIDLSHIPTNIIQMILDILYPPYSLPKEWDNFEIDFKRHPDLWSEDGDGEDGEDGMGIDMGGREELDDQDDIVADNADMDIDDNEDEPVEYPDDEDSDMEADNDLNNFYRHPPNYADNRNVQDHALKNAAQQLQLDHIIKLVEYKMTDDEDIEEHIEENESWDLLDMYLYNEYPDMHRMPFSFAHQSVRNSGLPIKFENRIEEVMMIDKEMEVDFLDAKWMFRIYDIDERYHDDNGLTRRSLGYTEDEWEIEKEALKEKYKYLKLNTPWSRHLLVAGGTISIEIKCDPPIKFDLKMKFERNEFSQKHQFIGQICKEVVESRCNVVIRMDIKHINAYNMRVYMDYQQYNPDICNATVTVGTDVFHVCKEILCFNSQRFYQLFQQSSNIELDDITPQDFRRVLNCIYPTQLVPYSWQRKYRQEGISDSIERLLKFADKYGIELIKDIVSRYICNRHCENVSWLVSMIEKYNMPKLSKSNSLWETVSLLNAFRHPDFRSWSVRTRIGIFDKYMDKVMWQKRSEEYRRRREEENDN